MALSTALLYVGRGQVSVSKTSDWAASCRDVCIACHGTGRSRQATQGARSTAGTWLGVSENVATGATSPSCDLNASVPLYWADVPIYATSSVNLQTTYAQTETEDFLTMLKYSYKVSFDTQIHLPFTIYLTDTCAKKSQEGLLDA